MALRCLPLASGPGSWRVRQGKGRQSDGEKEQPSVDASSSKPLCCHVCHLVRDAIKLCSLHCSHLAASL